MLEISRVEEAASQVREKFSRFDQLLDCREGGNAKELLQNIKDAEELLETVALSDD